MPSDLVLQWYRLLGLGIGAAARAVGLVGLVLILTGVHDTLVYWLL